MTKVKEKLYEHRFGMFFFGFLTIYSFLSEESLRTFEVHPWAQTFYAIDFSFGFCTKILPGAVFSFLLGTPTDEKIAIYLKVLYIILCSLISFTAEKYYKKVGIKGIFPFFAMVVFIYYTLFNHMVFNLLDFHWLILFFVFLICIFNKKFYFFIPLFFITAIMIHYSAMLCYVPLFAILVLYKAVVTAEPKEKKTLAVIFCVSVVISVGLFFYMLIFESQNVTYATYEQFREALNERGGTKAYYFAVSGFYKGAVNEDLIGMGVNLDNMLEGTDGISGFINMLITILRFTQFSSSGISEFFFLIPFVPVIYLMLKAITGAEKSVNRKGTRFTVFCIFSLFFLILTVGFIFSTDKVRWFCHALIAVTLYFTVTGFEEKHSAEIFENEASKISKSFKWFYALVLFSVYMDLI